MSERRRRDAAFLEELGQLIEQHWSALRPDLIDDDVTADDLEEMGDTYPGCWVLTIGAISIENPSAPAMAINLCPRGQIPFTGIGLLEDALHVWKG